MKAKPIIISLLTLFIFSFTSAQTSITNTLIGNWEGKDGDGTTGGLNFIDSIHVIVTIPGKLFPTGEYIIDSTKTPMWFDITFKQGKNVQTMTGIIKLINDTRLKWQISTTGKRSETFNKEKTDNTIILIKRSSLINKD